MPINPDAVGAASEPVQRSWSSTEALLYAVGVGAGTHELTFSTENSTGVDQQVLPTFAVVLGMSGLGALSAVGTFNPALMVHGEQGISLAGPLPVEGTVSLTSRVAAIYDKGNAAVVALEVDAVDPESGDLRFQSRFSAFLRGEGGWGGDRGPARSAVAIPERPCDHVVAYQTSKDQALIYRLSGDRNPLHSDPAFAQMAGFDRPILHGLCTYGFTGRALLHSMCGGDPARFKSMDGRFSKPVYPGDTLTVSIWVDGGTALFRTETQRQEVVIDSGRFEFVLGP